ncbi:MAG TPA: hypothetical protein VFG76_08330 [Candidatus Polarisedimenticolia bacterium]|nr:hypothetical protein [Candidatus Polarisedimenticolia bacterium]
MKRIILVFIVLLALFAAFVVLASSIHQLLLGESPKTARAAATHTWSIG